jgi:hypothetical protein
MSRVALYLWLVSILCPAMQARAEIASIRADSLPREAAILYALDDVREIEQYSRSYTQKWAYPISREDVAARLGKDLGFLRIALQAHPDNAELLLLAGLVAHYAYNLDLDGSYSAAMDALTNAEKRIPLSDVRAAWFRASLLCQTSEPKAGADQFLSIESSHPWNHLPAAFWDDYMECATVTAMAAHALRAADHLNHLHARNSNMRGFLTEAALKRFDAFDPAKTYEPRDVWTTNNSGKAIEFTSTTCGVRLRASDTWKVEDLSFRKGGCVAYFSTGPYRGTKHPLQPGIMMMVKAAGVDESLEEFAGRFSAKGIFVPFPAARCPAEQCISLKGVQPGMYGEEGDGHGRVLAFERSQPDYPGLLFESPWELPKPDGASGAKTYRPYQIKARIPGKLYYLVVLDTAASTEEPATADLDQFLRDLVVE